MLARYYNYYRIALLGSVLVLVESLVSVLLFTLLFRYPTTSFVSAHALIEIALALLLTYGVAKWYFQSPVIEATSLEGLRFGVGVVVLRYLWLWLIIGSVGFVSGNWLGLMKELTLETLSLTGLAMISVTLLSGWIVGWEARRKRETAGGFEDNHS